MKNQYKLDNLKQEVIVTFDDLKQEVIVTLDTHKNIFLRMRHLVNTGNLVLRTRDISKISESIPDGKYWITYNIVVTKGKKDFFLEDVVCAYKEEIIKFIQLSIEVNDLVDLIMLPTFEYEYEFVVRINEEATFFKYQK
jgi:hypothetical protein